MRNIDKRTLWLKLTKTYKRIIHHSHVLSVVNILIKELINELKSGKKIIIGNFGTFELRKTKPRKHFDLTKNKINISTGSYVLRFFLNKKLKKTLIKNIDLEKTFGIKNGKK